MRKVIVVFGDSITQMGHGEGAWVASEPGDWMQPDAALRPVLLLRPAQPVVPRATQLSYRRRPAGRVLEAG